MDLVDFEILNKFKEIAKRLTKLIKEVLADLNIELQDFKMLSAIDINGNFSQTDLSGICDIDKPRTSRLIEKLVQQNMVVRKVDNLDRRKTYIYLTDSGKELLKIIRKKMQNCFCKYFNRITEEDKNIFINLLDKTLNKEENLC